MVSVCNDAQAWPLLRNKVALAESLLSAIVRADGDALVMHVGERPYVVVGTQTINISTHGLNLDAMTGMLTQLLPAESQQQLEEFGAVEYKIPFQSEDKFTIVAARGGDDIWIEIRRRRPQPAAAPVAAPPAAAVTAPPPASAAPAPVAEPPKPVEEPKPIEQPAAVAQPAAIEQAAPIVHPAPIEQPRPAEVAAASPPALDHPADVAPQAPASEPEVPIATAPPEIAPAAAAEPPATEKVYPPPVLIPPPAKEPEPEPIREPEPIAEAVAESMPEPTLEVVEDDGYEYERETEYAEEDEGEEIDLDAEPEQAPIAAAIPESQSKPVAEPMVAQAPEPMVAHLPEPAVAHAPEPSVVPAPQPVATPEPAAAPIAASIERKPEPEPVVPATAATVVPMTRTVRIEVPPRVAVATQRAATDIERLLRIASARGASSLFLTSESRPWIRVEGDLRQLESEPALSRADVERAILEIAPESGQESIGKGEATEWIAEFTEIGRIRCTTFIDHRGPGVLLRMIATRAATAEQLGLSRELQALATESQGLVLVAGSRASGKTTLMSALVDLVNKQRAEFVITLERQIRLVHDNRAALVSQREIRGGADETLAAARAALRENPDVLVVDDLVSPQMVPLLLTAASEGLLVFVSITAPSTSAAIERLIELAPPEMRKAVQSAIAESFRGAVGQVLVKKIGGGLSAAREVLLATAPVTRVIGEGQLNQLPLVFESGRKYGMVSFIDALVEFVRAGTIDVREAYRKAPDRDRLLERLKREGIDTSIVERLA